MAQHHEPHDGPTPIIIKKYANRRLYNTDSSKYVTLDFLAELTRAGREFKVVDAKTGEDITHSVLTQIIMEEEQGEKPMLPTSFLRQLIALYGDSMQATVPQFLEASMETFRRNQQQLRDAIEGAMTAGPFGEIARQNLRMMGLSAERPADRASAPAGTAQEDELAALRRQISELEAKIDRLADRK